MEVVLRQFPISIFSLDQLSFFPELELNACQGALDEEEERGDKETPDKQAIRKYCRKKTKNTLLTLPANLPVKDVYVEPKETVCKACNTPLVDKGEIVTQRIVKQTSYSIVRTHYRKLECPNCDEVATVQEDDMLSCSVCDPVFLASVVKANMKDGVPLYRQEVELGESKITRKLMSACMMRAGVRIAYNLIPLLEEELNKLLLINCDETGVNVIKLKGEDGKKKAPESKSNAFMIVRVGTNSDGSPGLVIFTYSDNRRNQTIADLIGSYDGCVQTDGLYTYDNAARRGNFTHLGCLVHARRKAVEAAGNLKEGKAVGLVNMYANIFHQEGLINDKYKERNDAFVKERKEVLLPLFYELKEECENIVSSQIRPNKKLMIAANYFLERFDELTKFLDFHMQQALTNLLNSRLPLCRRKKGIPLLYYRTGS